MNYDPTDVPEDRSEPFPDGWERLLDDDIPSENLKPTTPKPERALECDAMARGAGIDELLGLLLLRHESLLRLGHDHGHKNAITEDFQSAKREILWRFYTQGGQNSH